MSDEREGRSRPDETRPFSYGGDGDPGGPGGYRGPDEDATRIQGPGAGNGPDDRTRSDDTWPAGGPEGRPGDGTSIMPPARDDWTADGEGAWAGRAAVRPPRAEEYVETDWATVEREPRRWWAPILVGIVALLLLALLGWGIWLIIQAQGRANETPAPAPTLSAPATVSTPSVAPTTTPPTTQTTTTSPTPTSVTIPALRGMSQSEAAQTLSRIGLASRLRFVATDRASAGVVVDTDPSEGKQVPQGTTVTLIVAAPPTASPSPSGGPVTVPGQ